MHDPSQPPSDPLGPGAPPSNETELETAALGARPTYTPHLIPTGRWSSQEPTPPHVHAMTAEQRQRYERGTMDEQAMARIDAAAAAVDYAELEERIAKVVAVDATTPLPPGPTPEQEAYALEVMRRAAKMAPYYSTAGAPPMTAQERYLEKKRQTIIAAKQATVWNSKVQGEYRSPKGNAKRALKRAAERTKEKTK